MKEKLVVFCASPRKQGFTNAMLQQLLSVLPASRFEVSVMDAYDRTVHPCTDCRACEKGSCPLNRTDDYADILQELDSATHILIASPIYFSGFPSPMKAIIDRSQQFFMNRANNRQRHFPLRRKGYLLLTAGASDERVNQAVRLSGEFFFRCMNADCTDTYLLENTDHLTDCPSIPEQFLRHFTDSAQ